VNLPPDKVIFDKLMGGIVDSLLIYRYQIGILLEGGNRIVVLCPFCFGRNDEIEQMEWVEFPIAKTEMTRILGSKVTHASAGKDHHLRIEFSTGDTLFVCWTPMYESYELIIEGKSFIV